MRRIIHKDNQVVAFTKDEIIIRITAIGNRQELEVYKNAGKRTH